MSQARLATYKEPVTSIGNGGLDPSIIPAGLKDRIDQIIEE